MNDTQINDSLLLFCGSQATEKALTQQLQGFLPQEVKIQSFCFEEEKRYSFDGLNGFAVFSSQEVFEEFKGAGFDSSRYECVITNRTMFNNNLDKILSLPRNEKILLVNDSKLSALESIEDLKSIGFDFLDLLPYYPDCPIFPEGINVAITPGEVDKVPSGIDSVYNIGSRAMDFPTVVKIMNHYRILEDKAQDYANLYLKDILDFAKRVSNIADDTIKVMKTVRRELAGTGYYAKYRFNDIVGESENIRKTKVVAKKIAMTDLSVLIEGESGTGKELFASAIHNASQRYRHPFVAINFSALPDHLLESELFGYEEGAFTGAKKGGKIGLFQQANGGTIFLDEIGDISLKMQAKLLRVIEEKEVMKIGGDRIIPVDVRIIAATNKNLQKMIEEKEFRKDLYYRLCEGYIQLPSLNERKSDIALLVDYWQKTMFMSRKTIDRQVMDMFMQHDWQGNIRELLNIIKYANAISEDTVITREDLPAGHPLSTVEVCGDFGREESKTSSPASGADEISLLVLAAVKTLVSRGELAGRAGIMGELCSKGVVLSEYKTRKMISELTEQGLLCKTKEKYGLQLTEKGTSVVCDMNFGEIKVK